jgi:hypothetical protein
MIVASLTSSGKLKLESFVPGFSVSCSKSMGNNWNELEDAPQKQH